MLQLCSKLPAICGLTPPSIAKARPARCKHHAAGRYACAAGASLRDTHKHRGTPAVLHTLAGALQHLAPQLCGLDASSAGVFCIDTMTAGALADALAQLPALTILSLGPTVRCIAAVQRALCKLGHLRRFQHGVDVARDARTGTCTCAATLFHAIARVPLEHLALGPCLLH